VDKRKGQNSILFLTTLGVYLGLVLVGATPQVLANAATTRNFDIRDEIEFQDKLDKDPDPIANGSALDDTASVKKDKFVPLARLLKQFRPFLPVDVFHSAVRDQRPEAAALSFEYFLYNDLNARIAVPRFSGLQVNRLARSSINHHLNSDAK
jgi:hypothetical protein